MTIEEYNRLPVEQQEKFLLEGGSFCQPTVEEQESKGSSVKEVSLLAFSNMPSAPVYAEKPVPTSNALLPLPFPTESSTTTEGEKEQLDSTASSSGKDVGVTPFTSSPTDSSIYGFPFENPLELLFCVDDNVASGKFTFHDWQVQFMLDFADERHTKDTPFLAAMRANNGSGKDLIGAACLVWLCMRYNYARGVGTNGSGVQLDNQTELHIRTLCEKVNRKFGNVWKCNYRFYECLVTHSPIVLFATDEPLKAEGFHPIESGRKMTILASEAKSIPDDIFTALSRCTGATARINISSTGAHKGFFYNKCSTAIDRKKIKDIKDVGATDYIEYKITAFDCPHITKFEIDTMANDMPGGVNGEAYKSAVLSEFGSGEIMVIIPYTYVWIATRYSEEQIKEKWIPEEHNKAGLDLADGGNESVLHIRNGNRSLKQIPFKFDNATETEEFLDQMFRENGLTHASAYVFGDSVGIGKPILDNLKRRRKWSNIRFVDSRRASSRPKTYKNYNADAWFGFQKLMENREIILFPDQQLITQLSNRHYKIIDGCIHQVLSKLEEKHKDSPSPDRADACILAYTDYKSTFVQKENEKSPVVEVEKEVEKVVGDFSLKSWARGEGGGLRGVYSKLEGGKDFSDLQEAISEYNKKMQLTKG